MINHYSEKKIIIKERKKKWKKEEHINCSDSQLNIKKNTSQMLHINTQL